VIFFFLQAMTIKHCFMKSTMLYFPLSARAMNYNSIPSLHDSCHDLLHAIHHEIKSYKTQWLGKHIKGHQDNDKPFNDLDRQSQLNVIVDCLAKEFLPTAAALPRHYEVSSPAWTIKLGNIPLLHHIDQTLYDVVHSPTVKDCWIKKIEDYSTDPSFCQLDTPWASTFYNALTAPTLLFQTYLRYVRCRQVPEDVENERDQLMPSLRTVRRLTTCLAMYFPAGCGHLDEISKYLSTCSTETGYRPRPDGYYHYLLRCVAK
jgi:hypothetical protein